MLRLEEAIKLQYKIVIWGTGKCFKDNIKNIKKHIRISAVCDNDDSVLEKNTYGIKYIKKDQLLRDSFIIIMVKNIKAIEEITEELNLYKLQYCLFEDALGYCTVKEEELYVEEHLNELSLDDSKWDNVMRKYVGVHVPATTCNLACPYCYIRQQKEFYNPPVLKHHPKYIRLCLSQKRLGGQTLIGLCGAGETLLADKFIDICVELLEEGHFLHIVTNGTLTDKIQELIEKSGKYISHVFFKFSFHYEELKRQNKLDVFASNVNFVSNAGASFTVELTTDDNLLGEIEEIKQFSFKNFGALPHITIARDDTKKEIPILTNLTKERYYEVWSQFESELFEVKWNYFGKFINHCMAGKIAIYINLLSGNIMRCLGHSAIGNLYNVENQLLEYDSVENQCVFPYCFNNHAYLTLGVCADIMTYSFAQVRDRVTITGDHWVKKEMYDFINQKLYKNNIC